MAEPGTRDADADGVRGGSPLPPDSWGALLDEVAAGRLSLTLESPNGGRVALLAADELTRLQGAARTGTNGTVRLTGRELEILSLLAAGSTGTGAAARLGLAPNTVAQHLVAARRKLGVRTSAAAVDAARRAGLLP
ncbi:helix-turn-helix transcriptional regulator [Motilibacter aurantiacus]|uniref:helix-turn-helix transcriptional regulator n=1 Tax=Motilibacter aurantiacus TaxID=2714955 RepID=UPI0014077A6D|nr:helix-turn-helix transcriptional regulator [Motilibacter aurantiacus]NHC46267.1 helix-turn-helix transcriptional regulator [Motilibacter aurantiacus]